MPGKALKKRELGIRLKLIMNSKGMVERVVDSATGKLIEGVQLVVVLSQEGHRRPSLRMDLCMFDVEYPENKESDGVSGD